MYILQCFKLPLEPAFSIMPVIQVGTGVCIRFYLVHCLLGFNRIYEQEGQSDECWDMKFAVGAGKDASAIQLYSHGYRCAGPESWSGSRPDLAEKPLYRQLSDCPTVHYLTVGHEYRSRLTGPEGLRLQCRTDQLRYI